MSDTDGAFGELSVISAFKKIISLFQAILCLLIIHILLIFKLFYMGKYEFFHSNYGGVAQLVRAVES